MCGWPPRERRADLGRANLSGGFGRHSDCHSIKIFLKRADGQIHLCINLPSFPTPAPSATLPPTTHPSHSPPAPHMPSTSSPTSTIGFIGIGNMGAPMARCLGKAGHRAALRPARRGLKPFHSRPNFETTSSLAEAATGRPTVITMLPDGDASKPPRSARPGQASPPAWRRAASSST